jgi:hypothetical protein
MNGSGWEKLKGIKEKRKKEKGLAQVNWMTIVVI